jgi:hypothetical protein
MEAKTTSPKAQTPSVVVDFLKLAAVSVAAALAFSTTASAVVLLLV